MANSFYIVEGMWGGEGGSPWTDGTYSDIKTITVAYGDVIDSLQVEYRLQGEDDDYVINAPRHGGDGGTVTPINFDEDEYLINIEGYGGKIGEGDTGDLDLIRSLTFRTNKATYGPYGSQSGIHFTTSAKGKIVGFHGRAGYYLDRIGIYAYKS